MAALVQVHAGSRRQRSERQQKPSNGEVVHSGPDNGHPLRFSRFLQHLGLVT